MRSPVCDRDQGSEPSNLGFTKHPPTYGGITQTFIQKQLTLTQGKCSLTKVLTATCVAV